MMETGQVGTAVPASVLWKIVMPVPLNVRIAASNAYFPAVPVVSVSDNKTRPSEVPLLSMRAATAV